MNITVEKEELMKRLEKVQDISLINAINNLLDFGLNKQEEARALEKSIDRALMQSKKRQVHPHDEVMKTFQQILKN